MCVFYLNSLIFIALKNKQNLKPAFSKTFDYVSKVIPAIRFIFCCLQ